MKLVKTDDNQFFVINDNEHEAILEAIQNEEKVVIIDGRPLRPLSLTIAIGYEEAEEVVGKAKGWWQCKPQGNWHNKAARCSCTYDTEEKPILQRLGLVVPNVLDHKETTVGHWQYRCKCGSVLDNGTECKKGCKN